MNARAQHTGPRAAFTLIEIMIVVAIMGIILGVGGPSMYRALRKEGMRKAVGDVIEACREARTAAILQRRTMVLTVLPGTRELRVGFEEQEQQRVRPVDPFDRFAGIRAGEQAAPAAAPVFSAQLERSVSLEMLDVNFVDHLKRDAARVRFFPSGSCDEFTIVLRSAQNEWRRLTLDVLTATVELEAIR